MSVLVNNLGYMNSQNLGHGQKTSEEIGIPEVYQEVDDVMSKLRAGMHKIKSSTRKYAFELQDIPKEADYLKCMYPYDSRLSCHYNFSTQH